MKPLTSVKNIKNEYIKRILSNIIGKDVMKILSSTPFQVKKAIAGLSDEQLRTPPGKGKWSIAKIVNHLSDAEVAFAFRLRMAVAQPGSPLQAYDENKWAASLGYDKADCRQKLGLFSVMRSDHVRLLKSLTAKQWKQFGMHEERGKETVERIAQMFAGHDVNHVKQIQTIRKQLLKKK